MANLKEQHDRLLANKPEGAVHDQAVCPLCQLDDTEDTATATQVAALKTENTVLKTDNAALRQQVEANAMEAARMAERDELEQRMAARATAALDAGFPARRVGEFLERWEAMPDDVFEAFVDGLAALPSAPAETRIPTQTALHVGRESSSTSSNPLKEWSALRREAGGYIDFSLFH